MPKQRDISTEQRKAFGEWMTKHYIAMMQRLNRAIDQGELAEALDIDRTLINKYLTGQAIPGDGKTIRIANFFKDEEVYDILGYERPALLDTERCLSYIKEIVSQSPDYDQLKIELDRVKSQYLLPLH